MIWYEKPVHYDKIQEITQEKNKNPTVFLSQVTESFKKYSNILSPQKGRHS